MKNLYYNYHDKVWGRFGFYNAFSVSASWYPKQFLAIDEGPIAVMIENYGTGLFWKLFMSCPEIQQGLTKPGFQSPYLN